MKSELKSLRKTAALGLILGAAGLWTACGETPQGDTAITETSSSEAVPTGEEKERAERVKHIFHAVPSPMEMASMLKRTGAQYDANLLNDVKNVNSYNTARSKALNLGIYGAGLSYASVFNQNQESIIFLSCTKKLADKLGVSKAFDEETIERMEANVDNRDSLLNIVSETYYLLDAYLKENGREHISAMVIAAGWIEGLHISTSVARGSEAPSEELMTRIADQKISLGNLIDLVEAYNTDNKLEEIHSDLLALREVFNSTVQTEKGETALQTAEDGTAVIGAKTKTQFTAEGLESIYTAVNEIRTRYIS